LLVRPAEEEAIVFGLSRAGYARKGKQLALFSGASAELVEAIPAAAWRLPDVELDALFDEAVPIKGFAHLVRPAPHHALLILARRVVEGRGALDQKRAGYIERA